MKNYDARHAVSNLLTKGVIDANQNQELFEVAVRLKESVSDALAALGMNLRVSVEKGMMIATNMTPEQIERAAASEGIETIQPVHKSVVMRYFDSVTAVLLRIHYDEDLRGGTGEEAGWIFEEDLAEEFSRYQRARSRTNKIGMDDRLQTILNRLAKQGFVDCRSISDVSQYRMSKIGLMTFTSEECADFMTACKSALSEHEAGETSEEPITTQGWYLT